MTTIRELAKMGLAVTMTAGLVLVAPAAPVLGAPPPEGPTATEAQHRPSDDHAGNHVDDDATGDRYADRIHDFATSILHDRHDAAGACPWPRSPR